MEQDSIINDTVPGRPLPEWLIKQKEGLNNYKPEVIVMKEDRSLEVSFLMTGAVILFIVILLTILFIRKNGSATKGERY